MTLALQDEINRSEESRYDHRLHGVLLVAQGNSCYQVAEWLGQHPTTVERWVRRFEQRGMNALREAERPGRPGRLDDKTWEAIERDLRIARLLSHHLRSSYGIALGVRQCQRLFWAMGFRRRKPRPLIAPADPEAQRAFKKTRPPGG
jgi:transposase